jgi:ATP-dependent Clp protease ATP-binding subunit ClpC
VFERFTERARQVVVFAQEEARDLKHNYIGTEHLLLGVLRVEDGLGARVLADLGVRLDEVRGQVTRIVGPGDEEPSGQIPFTPRAKKVLELALREARRLGSSHIGTEHILLGIVREGDGVAARILLHFEADAEKIRRQYAAIVGAARSSGGYERHVESVDIGESVPWGSYGGEGERSLVLGWALFAVSLGIGILIGWAIWGL